MPSYANCKQGLNYLVIEELCDEEDPVFETQLKESRSKEDALLTRQHWTSYQIFYWFLILLVAGLTIYSFPRPIKSIYGRIFINRGTKRDIRSISVNVSDKGIVSVDNLSLNEESIVDQSLSASISSTTDAPHDDVNSMEISTNDINLFEINGDDDCSYVYDISDMENISLVSGSMTSDNTFYFQPPADGEYELLLQQVCSGTVTQSVVHHLFSS